MGVIIIVERAPGSRGAGGCGLMLAANLLASPSENRRHRNESAEA